MSQWAAEGEQGIYHSIECYPKYFVSEDHYMVHTLIFLLYLVGVKYKYSMHITYKYLFFYYRNRKICFHIKREQLQFLAKKVSLFNSCFSKQNCSASCEFPIALVSLTFSQSFTVLSFSLTVNENTAHTMFKELIEHISSLIAALGLAIKCVMSRDCLYCYMKCE